MDTRRIPHLDAIASTHERHVADTPIWVICYDTGEGFMVASSTRELDRESGRRLTIEAYTALVRNMIHIDVFAEVLLAVASSSKELHILGMIEGNEDEDEDNDPFGFLKS